MTCRVSRLCKRTMQAPRPAFPMNADERRRWDSARRQKPDPRPDLREELGQ